MGFSRVFYFFWGDAKFCWVLFCLEMFVLFFFNGCFFVCF